MKTSNSDPLKTMLTISIGFLVVYFITKYNWAVTVSLIVGSIGVLSTYLSKKIHFLWMKLGWVLSLILPNIVLTLLFFIILFPVALLSRLFGEKDPLRLKNKYDSVFKETNKQFDPCSFENPW